MFEATSKAIVKCLGAREELICNDNINTKIKMLTLVKVKEKPFWSVAKPTITDQTLYDLLQGPDISPEYTEEVLMEDFNNLRDRCGGARVTATSDAANVGMEMSAAVDSVDGASSFTLKKKTVDIVKLRKSCTDRKINKTVLDMLQLKETEKLTFVDQTVYNTAPVTFHGKARKSGFVSAVCEKFRWSLWSKNNEERSFTITKDITFAFSLMEITTKDNTLGIPPRFMKMKRYNKGWRISSDGDDETLQQVTEEIFDRADLLQPLAELPESRRHDLLTTLTDLLPDRDVLALLEETLDQSSKGVFECPQSAAVSSFMDLLDVPEVTTAHKDAVHLLVNTMDTLPDDAAVLLATCSPETLKVLQQLVSSLKEGTQAKLPESLPVALQEEGRLRWVAELLCLTNETLTELRDQWDRPEFPPQVLLELVCLVVQGLSLMRPKTHS